MGAGAGLLPAAWGTGLTLLLALGLAKLWRRWGWGDAARGVQATRKRQRSPVPAVGGLALAAGWCVQASLTSGGPFWQVPTFEWIWPAGTVRPASWVPWAALGLALASGTLDDGRRAGLGPLAKLFWQGAAGALLAWSDPSLASLTLLAGLSALHQNALNTFDNADGAATALCAAGLFACGSPLAPVVLVFLWPNLWGRHGPRGVDPRAYLGDAGSSLLGLALLMTPGAWPILVLPLFDLARLSLVRLRLGIPPWRGDRRHLAHRLQERGLGPVAVVLCLLAVASPVFFVPETLGVGLCALAYGLALHFSRDQTEAA